jgi:serine/threonine-protein kinase
LAGDWVGPTDAAATVGATGAFDDLPLPAESLVIADKYRVLSVLGRGGMGGRLQGPPGEPRPHRCRQDAGGGVHAAADARRRFVTEARAVARFKHPGIVALYDWGEHQGLPFFSMEYVAGESLEARLKRGVPSWNRSAELMQAVAEAVQYAHDQLVLHRDLNPGNILLDEAGRPKVADFGLAKPLDSSVELTSACSVLGSVSYMPPEQASERWGKPGRASDVYGLGAILYHLLTGRPPFVGDLREQVIQQVLKDEPVGPVVFRRSIDARTGARPLSCQRMKSPRNL